MKISGINRVFNISDPQNTVYKETVSGVLGLGPPKDEEAKKRHFLHQLKDKGVIDHLTFAIYIESQDPERSDIKFGSYDTARIEEGHTLQMIETLNDTTWAL
jgi:hypothetical protein